MILSHLNTKISKFYTYSKINTILGVFLNIFQNLKKFCNQWAIAFVLIYWHEKAKQISLFKQVFQPQLSFLNWARTWKNFWTTILNLHFLIDKEIFKKLNYMLIN